MGKGALSSSSHPDSIRFTRLSGVASATQRISGPRVPALCKYLEYFFSARSALHLFGPGTGTGRKQKYRGSTGTYRPTT